MSYIVEKLRTSGFQQCKNQGPAVTMSKVVVFTGLPWFYRAFCLWATWTGLTDAVHIQPRFDWKAHRVLTQSLDYSRVPVHIPIIRYYTVWSTPTRHTQNAPLFCLYGVTHYSTTREKGDTGVAALLRSSSQSAAAGSRVFDLVAPIEEVYIF